MMRLFTALLALLCGIAQASAQDMIATGTALRGVLTLNGKQVPLPEGEWVVAADGPSDWSNPAIGAYGYLRTLVLFRSAGNRIDAVAEINTNALPTADGWGMAAECARTDLIMAVVRYRAGWDGSCFFVTHTLTTAETTPAWKRARDFARLKNWAFSPTWVTAGFRSANRSDVIDVRFHLAPEAYGFATETPNSWRASGWMATRLDREPARLAFTHAVSDWALQYSDLLEGGIKNRLPAEVALAMPRATKGDAPETMLQHRLAELETLRKSGALTAEEFAVQARALQEAGDGSSSTAPDLGTITAVKALSYRVIVSISHIFVDYYWTGNYVATGALEILQITINSAKFYFHELAWARWVGFPRNDAARTLDFKYIGVGI
ncbi:MAG: DUF2061 domain-containing protein [Acetobacteraceae bacterium]